MLAKRIIPCLDVKDNKVVKGIKFRDHIVVGDIVELAHYYCETGADELVFYDITASSDHRVLDYRWIQKIAKIIDIPFCVAGGIRDVNVATMILAEGADKISINSPALENPELISQLAHRFGSQCVVVGVDSYQDNDDYFVYQYTGDPQKTKATQWRTMDWIKKVIELGAGEVVINCMNQDGMRQGYDVTQLAKLRQQISVPIIASGGAGCVEDFLTVFNEANVDGALAASVFHNKQLGIAELKQFLNVNNIRVRL